MTSFYSKEKSKYGTLSGTIIIWPVEYNTDPISPDNVKILPAGYLKCDGSKYNASSYPQLAEILGVGTSTRFLKRDLDGNPVFEVKDTEFVVPDLGSKFPRPVPGPDAGTYNSVLVRNSAGVEVKKSGVGITAESSLGTTIRLSYIGKFAIPSQTIPLVGKTVWTSGTNNLKRTEMEGVESTAIHSHMHFSTTRRTRIKSTNTVTANLEPSTGRCFYRTGTTVNIENWLNATTHPDASGEPGSNQPPCWAIASNASARQATGSENPRDKSIVFGLINIHETYTYDACWNGGDQILSELRYQCLLTEPATYRIGNESYFGSPGTSKKYYLPEIPLIGCNFDSESNLSDGTVPATYTTGTAPSDWRGISLVDVVPLNSNFQSAPTRGYSQIENVMNEAESPSRLYASNLTIHNHEILLERDDQEYTMVTEATLMDPDALNTQLTLKTSTAVSLDAVSAPFIIMEYLIKI